MFCRIPLATGALNCIGHSKKRVLEGKWLHLLAFLLACNLFILSEANRQHMSPPRSFLISHPSPPVIDQYKCNLPTGCELTSCSMLLQWFSAKHGVDGSEVDLTPQGLAKLVEREPLPSSRMAASTEVDAFTASRHSGGNPQRAMVGDPFHASGFGMFHGAMMRLLSDTLRGEQLSWRAVNLTGMPLADLLREMVGRQTPVITWTTLKQREPKVTDTWLDYKDPSTTITWKSPEHAVLLVGYDLDERVVVVNDPDTGRQERYDLNTFAMRYDAIGKQAVTIQKITQ